MENQQSSSVLAVQVCNAAKSYKGTSRKPLQVFDQLNLNVSVGSIYALLGPSGCGKTSLLRCIVGRQKLDKGSILVFGHYPGSVESGIPGKHIGYMPQDAGLIDTMNIEECLWYYASIVGLPTKKIECEIKKYVEFLKLPSKSTLTSNLSGGQARRLSFAIALIHTPRLVILDEPTVGVDPILKDGMWKHLLHLSATKNITIILTTHYIEEAQQAHRVGLMHGGTMAAEDSTKDLLNAMQCTSLEEGYLKLCTKEWIPTHSSVENGHSCNNNINVTQNGGSTQLQLHKSTYKPFRELHVRAHILKSVILKNLYFLIRFPGALVVAILPALTFISFYISYEGPISTLDMYVVNDDFGTLGNTFLSYIDNDILRLKNYQSYSLAYEGFRNGDSFGLIYIPHNFSVHLYSRMSDGPMASKEVLDSTLMDLFVDAAYYHIKFRVEYHVLSTFRQFLWYLTNSTVVDIPVKFNEELYSSLANPTFRLATFNCVMMSMYFFGVAGTVLSLFVELQKGYLERSFVAGATATELLFGMMILQYVIILVQSLLVVLLFIVFFNEDIKGSLILMFCLLCITAIGGAVFGIFMSLAIEQFYIIVLIGALSVLLTGCTSAAYFPVEAMPYFFQYFCKATPLMFPVQSLKNIIHHGWGLSSIYVSAGFIGSLLWIAIFLAISIKLLISIKSSQ